MGCLPVPSIWCVGLTLVYCHKAQSPEQCPGYEMAPGGLGQLPSPSPVSVKVMVTWNLLGFD